MMPQLSEASSLSAMGVASLAGLFYWGYSPFSLVAGVLMDRLGPRRVVPFGAAAVGVGARLFASGNADVASAGRLLQGAGGVFALIAAAAVVLLGAVAFIPYGPGNVLPPFVLALVTGIASGAATLPYTVIKEAKAAFAPLLYGVALALVLTLVLKETGPAARRAAPAAAIGRAVKR